MERVVITGLGWSTSLGPTAQTCWEGLVAGKSGIRPITRFDTSGYAVHVAAQVDDVPRSVGSDGDPIWLRRTHRMYVPVMKESFADAGLVSGQFAPERIGVAAASSVNYIDHRLIPEFFRARLAKSPSVNWERLRNGVRTDGSIFYRRHGDILVGLASRILGVRGPSFVTDTACAASAHAIGEAYRLIRRGKAAAMIAGGSAALVAPIGLLAFALLGALSRSQDPSNASKPFDKDRDGFVMGEGAGAVVLESLGHAQARGARIYAELVGFGASSGGYSLTDPSPDGSAEAQAMQMALRESGSPAQEVDYIAAHGTSTLKNDATETRAIRRVFGSHAARLLVSSNKGQIGHTISAAGVSNLIATVKAINEGVAPPTMNLHRPDPECDLDYVANCSRPARIRLALSNAFAFGGQNVTLAIRAWNGV